MRKEYAAILFLKAQLLLYVFFNFVLSFLQVEDWDDHADDCSG
jgi:hypothetical protein